MLVEGAGHADVEDWPGADGDTFLGARGVDVHPAATTHMSVVEEGTENADSFTTIDQERSWAVRMRHRPGALAICTVHPPDFLHVMFTLPPRRAFAR